MGCSGSDEERCEWISWSGNPTRSRVVCFQQTFAQVRERGFFILLEPNACPLRTRAMKALEPVILVRELPPVCSRQRQHLPSLRDLVSATSHPMEPSVLTYLSQGADCGIYNDPGLLYDVLQPGKRI